MKREGLTRRHFIAATSAAGVTSLSATAGTGQVQPATLSDRLISLIPNRESAIAVGRAARLSDGASGAAQALLDRASAAGLDGQRHAQFTDETLRQMIARWARDDFRCGRVAEIDGWRMAESEVGLTMLIMSAGDPLAA
ncbi:MAG: hypothetical protein AAF317_10910 [Pseudomonadota bacterium]